MWGAHCQTLFARSRLDWARWAESEDDPCHAGHTEDPAALKLGPKPDSASTTADSDSTDADEGSPPLPQLAAFVALPKADFVVRGGFVQVDGARASSRRTRSCPALRLAEPETEEPEEPAPSGPKKHRKKRKATRGQKPLPPWWSLSATATEGPSWAFEPDALEREHALQVAAEVEACGATTLLVKNIPSRLPRAEILSTLDALELKDRYDLVWLPFDRASLKWKGFCFLNFTSAEAAGSFCRAAPQIRFSLPHQQVSPSVAHGQGLEDMLGRIRQSLQTLLPDKVAALAGSVIVRTPGGLRTFSPEAALDTAA